MPVQRVYINGKWREANASSTFQATNPATKNPLPNEYPVSTWQDCDAALNAATRAHDALRRMPPSRIAAFLDRYAAQIDVRKNDIVEVANAETAYPKSPRLDDIEFNRTTGQLRAASEAAREGSWRMATIDSKDNIRSCNSSLGPVCVFGPNNFPLAFGSVSGGDFAAAIAAGNPVIGKANSSHPGTTQLFAEIAEFAAQQTEMPPGTVQLIYRTSHEDGERLVSDPRTGATGYTGSREAGLVLKAAADAAGKPIYLELSSVNPVLILPGALKERAEKIAAEFTTSCLMGVGQFCTNPGLVILIAGDESNSFVNLIVSQFDEKPDGTLLSRGVSSTLATSVQRLVNAGAEVLTGNKTGSGDGFSFANTLLQISGEQFLADPETMQAEAFGNTSMVVVAQNVAEACAILDKLEGNLTGCVYSDTRGSDDKAYDQVAHHMRPHVGRLLNDKMPTGVAVTEAMNHGGPFPATGHPGFTAVGIPTSLIRFAALQCFDNVRENRLPDCLKNPNPNGKMWRRINGNWSQKAVVGSSM